MDLSSINWIAVFVATGAAFALGAVWYGPLLFGKRWQALVGITDEEIQTSNVAGIYGGAFVLQAIAVIVLTVLIAPEASMGEGALTGLGVGAAWVATAMGVTSLFARTPFALYLINAGYHVAYYTIAGAVIGAF
ncbi:MAG: DUF1761 domain-containing protein [Bacteroidota bacterium]